MRHIVDAQPVIVVPRMVPTIAQMIPIKPSKHVINPSPTIIDIGFIEVLVMPFTASRHLQGTRLSSCPSRLCHPDRHSRLNDAPFLEYHSGQRTIFVFCEIWYAGGRSG